MPNIFNYPSWRMTDFDEEIDEVLCRATCLMGALYDERDHRLFERVQASGSVIYQVLFDNASRTIRFVCERGNIPYQNKSEPVENTELFVEHLRNFNTPIVLNITGMDIAAIFLLIKAFKGYDNDLYAIYTLPEKYVAVTENGRILPNYKLSDSVEGFGDIPGFFDGGLADGFYIINFLGFEGNRFFELNEAYTTEHNDIISVIALPSISSGLHMQTIYQNSRHLKDAGWLQDTYRIAMWDTFSTLKFLESSKNKNPSRTIAVSPFGTRPHTLACAIFASIYEDVAVFYDRPFSQSQRSLGIGRTYLYKLKGLI